MYLRGTLAVDFILNVNSTLYYFANGVKIRIVVIFGCAMVHVNNSLNYNISEQILNIFNFIFVYKYSVSNRQGLSICYQKHKHEALKQMSIKDTENFPVYYAQFSSVLPSVVLDSTVILSSRKVLIQNLVKLRIIKKSAWKWWRYQQSSKVIIPWCLLLDWAPTQWVHL